MAKDFGKMSNVTKKIETVAKKSNERGNVITVKMLNSSDLIDYPKNGEDIEMTEDLELSMKQNGFTDPLEVTTYGCDDGKYMIVSGHRRRRAGVNIGLKTFPCIIKNFKNENEVFNYVLLANSQRDSARDPLLFCKRYKMHEECLKNSNFKGNIREEIAKRLGLSTQQADRYNQMNKVILSVWDMIKDEKVGMSSVLPMSNFFPEHQEEIFKIFNECLSAGERLSRDMCKKIIDGYKAGKNTYFEIVNKENNDLQISSAPTPPTPDSETEPKNTGINIKEEYLPNENKESFIADSKSKNIDNSSMEINQGLDAEAKNDFEEQMEVTTEPVKDEKKEDVTPIDKNKKVKNLTNIMSQVEKIQNMLNEHYSCDNEKMAELFITTMVDFTINIVDEMGYVSDHFCNSETEFKKSIKRIYEYIKSNYIDLF